MAGRGMGGSQKLLLFLLLGIVAGFGTWNYRRNLEAEQAEPRPFRSYSDNNLAALAAAYQQELDTYAKRYQAATGGKVRVSDGRLLGDQVREFERVQRLSRSTRALAAGIAEREASLAAIDRENAKRVEESQKLTLFLKRAFVYKG